MTNLSKMFDRQCDDCEHLFNVAEAQDNPGYECSRCGEQFTYHDADYSRRCPNCKIFAAKVTNVTCPECGSFELSEGEFTPPPPPTPEEIAAAEVRRAAFKVEQAARQAEYNAEVALKAERWAKLGPALTAVLPDTRVPRWFAEGCSAVSITIDEVETLSAAITGTAIPPDPKYPPGDFEAMSAVSNARHGRWAAPDGPAEAFRGLPSGTTWRGEVDLADFMRGQFGEGRASGTGLEEEAWAAIAERLDDLS